MGPPGQFYYLLLDEDLGEAARLVNLYLANIEDGTTIAKIGINDRFGKLFNDDTRYGAKYHPMFSAELKYSQL